MKNFTDELISALSKAVLQITDDNEKCAILFSGGLDSSLLAWLAKEHSKITLYTVGTPHSLDLISAKEAARLLGMNLKCIEITQKDIIGTIPKLAGIINTNHPVKISYELPLFLAMANIEEDLILSGQGADELFGGYARYLRMGCEDLKNALERDLNMLISTDIHMDFIIAAHFKKNLKTPYLDVEVVNLARDIPIEHKVNEEQRKIILKKAAMSLGLPRDIACKEKKAVQYSSGIIKELRKIAKRERMTVNELIQHLIEK